MGTYAGVELDDLTLGSDRLLLRPWAADEAERELAAHTGTAGRTDGTGLDCAVVEQVSGRVIGSCLLTLGTDPEIGYRIAPDHRGHGYSAEAARTLAMWGFERGVARILLACDVRNLASARTALAAGFRFEGSARNAITSSARPGVPEQRGELARFARLPGDPGEPIAPAFPPFPPAGLSDGVLALRPVVPQDATAAAEAEDEVANGWGFTDSPRTADEWREVTARSGLEWLVGGTAQLAMVDSETASYAGGIQLRKAGPPQVGGIGYTVHPAFRGRAFTTRALRLLTTWAFEQADYARLELGAKSGNVASQRAAASAGFLPDGVRQARLRNPDGTFADEVRFALVNPRHAGNG